MSRQFWLLRNQGRALPSAGNRSLPCRPPPDPLQGGYSNGSGLNASAGSDARAFHDSPLGCLCLPTNELLNNFGSQREVAERSIA